MHSQPTDDSIQVRAQVRTAHEENLLSYSQEQLDAMYLRSVNSFFCPRCLMGFCRIDLDTMTRPYNERTYTCDKCGAHGTKADMLGKKCVTCKTPLVNGHFPKGCSDNKVVAAILSASKPIDWELLTWARQAAQDKWYSGQTVWIVPDKAFLKEYQGYVNLHIVGLDKSLAVFILSPMLGWVEVLALDKSFAKFIKEVSMNPSAAQPEGVR
jgi:predicted RNA-binding Zn-ribbon protein involved in translation (DUF1610 family)